MEKFLQFLESKETKKQSTYELKGVMDLASAIRDVIKKYSRQTRDEIWKKITSKSGDKEMKKLLRNPSMNLSGFRKL